MLLRHQRQALPRLAARISREVIIEGRTRRARSTATSCRQPATAASPRGRHHAAGEGPDTRPASSSPAPSQQCRTRHRHQHRRHQPHRMQTGITPEPVPQRHVHAVAAQVHHRRRGLDPLDTRGVARETRQPAPATTPRTTPSCSPSRSAATAPAQHVHRRLDLRERLPQQRMRRRAVSRQPQALALAREQRHAQPVLQQANLLADRAASHARASAAACCRAPPRRRRAVPPAESKSS